jgi:hypothetical protein
MILSTALNARERSMTIALGRTVAAGLAYNVFDARGTSAEFELS